VTATVDPPVLDLPAEAAGPTPEPGCPGRHRRTLILGLVLLPLWAVVCTSVLETPMWWGEVNHAIALFAALSKPLDVLCVLLVLLLLWCVTGRLWLSMGLLLGVTAGLSAVNVAKMSILTEPLYPSDYQFLHDTRFLLDMVKPVSVVEAVVGLVVVTAATVAASIRR